MIPNTSKRISARFYRNNESCGFGSARDFRSKERKAGSVRMESAAHAWMRRWGDGWDLTWFTHSILHPHTFKFPPQPPSPRWWSAHSAADDVPPPGLMLAAWFQVGDVHLHRLDLLVFGRNGADLVGHLVSFHRDVLALNTGRENKTNMKSRTYKKKTPSGFGPT